MGLFLGGKNLKNLLALIRRHRVRNKTFLSYPERKKKRKIVNYDTPQLHLDPEQLRPLGTPAVVFISYPLKASTRQEEAWNFRVASNFHPFFSADREIR